LNIQAEVTLLGNTTDKQEKFNFLQNKLLEIAKEHKDKDFRTELDNLCQVQIELVKSQVELATLQEQQQSQIQISP
jgi:hypothetical protein